MFDAGKMVPTKEQERDALTTFLLSAAPTRESGKEEREHKFHGAPDVGEAAPGFSVTDVQGRKFALASLKGKKPLVLIFSRAHW
jgi:cytochrome oxidase Cu insertion factor (SCO1/SenC/PrrC family)